MCTSDAIYKDKTGMYDLLVDCSGSDILPSTLGEHHDTKREPVMRAVIRENGQVTLKYLSYTYSDTVLWNTISPFLLETTSAESGAPDTTGSPTSAIWSTAIGTYIYICDICWGLCAFASGSGYTQHADHHENNSTGYIRLPMEENGERETSDDEEYVQEDDDLAAQPSLIDKPNDNVITPAIQILKILDHRRDHIEKRLAKVVSDTGTPILSKEDMRQMGLSAWSWVDVEFVRSLYRARKAQPITTGTLGNGLLVEKGWFRRAIGYVGL
ncbi:hypothetical protein QFC22_002434 [Naganishia vaughanmartiniae]|uniref:Uncharacterized protein n=1 Tax=Naganishia vaughanmartiniae TaxID=1424756 RepID=A0ACC2XFK3_9TREE|nr:hypothetical protein QFC22_002434 [Naganishia vaughanmartiniae]